MPCLASEDQPGCFPRARNAGTLEPNSHDDCLYSYCHNNKPYTIAQKTPRTWWRNQPPFDQQNRIYLELYIIGMRQYLRCLSRRPTNISGTHAAIRQMSAVYTITHKTPRTWRRNQPPFDTHDNDRASCYSTSMTAVKQTAPIVF